MNRVSFFVPNGALLPSLPPSSEVCTKLAKMPHFSALRMEVPMQLVKQDGRVSMIADPRVSWPRQPGSEVSGLPPQPCNQASRNRDRVLADSKKIKKRKMAHLQCEVPGVSYHASQDRWVVKPSMGGKQRWACAFCTKRFKTDKNSWLEARYEAMQAAISKIRELRRLHEEEKAKGHADANGMAELKRNEKLCATLLPKWSSESRKARDPLQTFESPASQRDCYGKGSVSWDKGHSAFRAQVRFKSDGKQRRSRGRPRRP